MEQILAETSQFTPVSYTHLYNMVLASNVDELNFLAARLETLSAGERAELNADLQEMCIRDRCGAAVLKPYPE